MRYFCSVFTLLFILSCLSLALCQNLNTQQVEIMKKLSTFSSSWNTSHSSVDPCNWDGVVCGDGSVTKLNLSGLGFKGNIWKTVCELPVLERLDVSNNSLSIPSSEEIISCTNLTYLNVSSNGLSGTLPSLTPLKKLQYLDLSRNMLEGEFGFQLQNLTELQLLSLSYNRFTGSIPYIGDQKLEHLDVSRNNLSGEIPQGLMKYTNLNYLDLSSNALYGTIPVNIGSLLKLQQLLLSSNNLSGNIPTTLGDLTQLTRFAVNYNNLNGTIPVELSSITGLDSLDLSYNSLNGTIPSKVFGLSQLHFLDLTHNSLSGSIPQNFPRNLFRLRIGNNNLDGAIPSTIGNALGLTYLEMNNNILEGQIPVQLGNCFKLLLLDLGYNQLRGPLTSVMPKLLDLQYLKLPNNSFEGSIINELSGLQNLTYVDLSNNLLSESISSSNICDLKGLQNLRLQNNHLTGTIPQTINNCRYLLELQLGSNNLTGTIPQGISTLSRLQIALNLSFNSLEGTIPRLLSSLVTLEILDLSNNRLTGEIPTSLGEMKSLTILDLSNNNLTGSIPAALNRTSLSLNTKGNPGLSYGESHSLVSKKKKLSAVLLIGVAIGGAMFALGTVALSMLACKYFKHEEPEIQEMQVHHKIEGHFIHPDSIHSQGIDFEKGVEATMDPANVVLKNKFSTYYKAAMPSGTNYSVKKLSWTDKIFKAGSYRRLEAELEKQGRLNHPNIMTPLAYVLDTDCAYLFYEYVHKGSLAEFLHTTGVCVLDWPSRCSIAIGIAQGLAFLHGSQHSILHLDLTTKNILLKSLSEAQLADVELCKMVDPSKSTGSLSAIAGSVGYIPPEYAYTMRVTAAGNVYSFGVILLELLTGKPPITGGMDLAKWVQSTLSGEEAWEQILDMRIRNFSLQIQNEMLSMLKLALSCISSSPDTRPKMRTVVGTLQQIRQTP